MCANLEAAAVDLKTVGGIQNDGATKARASPGNVHVTLNDHTGSGGEDTVVKKRKTRRGKSKRRNPNPYAKLSWQQRKNMNKQLHFNRKFRANVLNHGQALAPFNSNQFLMEDHGDLQELDDKLNKSDGASTSLVPPRTRDSSFSVDSDGDFYSSPEDEEEFLTKEFDHAYEDLHAERLQSMSKDQLIVDFIQMETKFELMKNQQRGKTTEEPTKTDEHELQQQINKLLLENDELRRENEILRSGLCRTASSLSSTMDSESDSSSSTCHSSTATSNSRECEMKDATPIASPVHINYAETNGFSPHQTSPTSV